MRGRIADFRGVFLLPERSPMTGVWRAVAVSAVGNSIEPVVVATSRLVAHRLSGQGRGPVPSSARGGIGNWLSVSAKATKGTSQLPRLVIAGVGLAS